MTEHNRRRPVDLGSTRPGLGQGGERQQRTGGRPAEPSVGRHADAYRHGHRPIEHRRRSRALTWALNLGLGFVALVVGLATFLFIAGPTDIIRDRLIAEVRERTGRELVIGGSTHFTLLPSVGLSAARITLSAPPGMPGEPLLVADRIEVSVAPLPLVMREIRIERLVLTRPRISLRIDEAGRRSWDFADATLPADGRIRLAQAGSTRTDSKRDLETFAKNATAPTTVRPNPLGAGLGLDDVRIVDGRLSWADARTGIRHDLEGIDARVSLPRVAGPLDVKGSIRLAGERFDVSTNLTSLADALEARQTRARIAIKGKPLSADYDGLVTVGQSLNLDGRISLAGPSAAIVARLGGFELQGGDGLAIALDGRLEGNPQRFALSDAKAAIGETDAQGRLAVDNTTPRPRVQAAVKIGTLDLDRLTKLSIAPAAGASALAPATATPASAPPPVSAPKSIEELIERSMERAPQGRPTPQVRGFTRRAGEGWNQDPLEAAALRRFDLEGRFDVERLLWQQAEATQIHSTLNLSTGMLRFGVTDARLYGGHAKALVTLDARQDTLVLGANISTDGVALLPLLKALGGTDTLDGRGRIIVAVSGQGASERDLVSTLDGKAELNVTDGAVIGWSVNEMTSGLASGRLPNLDRNPNARTPFTRLSATMPIAKGVGRTQDIRLESPSVEATGGGLVNFVDRNVDITVKPKAAGATGVAAIEVPVRIAGNWGDIRAIPDLNAAMRSPQAQEAVRQIGRQLQNGDIDGALRGVLGSEEKANKAKDAIRQFLGR